VTLLMLLLTLAVVAGVIAVATGVIRGGLDEPAQTIPARALPADAITGRDVASLRFVQGLRGYRMDQVDAALDALAVEVDRLRAQVAQEKSARVQLARGGLGTASGPETAEPAPGAPQASAPTGSLSAQELGTGSLRTPVPDAGSSPATGAGTGSLPTTGPGPVAPSASAPSAPEPGSRSTPATGSLSTSPAFGIPEVPSRPGDGSEWGPQAFGEPAATTGSPTTQVNRVTDRAPDPDTRPLRRPRRRSENDASRPDAAPDRSASDRSAPDRSAPDRSGPDPQDRA
jgi:DivIVA domain-containing protein